MFSQEDIVEIVGLSSDEGRMLNGCRALVIQKPNDSLRYQLQIIGQDDRVFLCKPENM